jgi:hypothetical protein
LLVGLALLFCGCTEQAGETTSVEEGKDAIRPGRVEDVQINRDLGPEEARQALIEMIEHRGDHQVSFLALALPQVKAFGQGKAKRDEIRVETEGEVQIGPFCCELKERRFNAVMLFPKALRHRDNFWTGVFERSPSGKWRAKITSFKSGH